MAKKSVHGLSPEQVDRILSLGTDWEARPSEGHGGDPKEAADEISDPAGAGHGDGANPRWFLAGRAVRRSSLMEQPGQMIGRYKLLEKIGEGGFGVVYAARQQAPVVRRVALKIIKPGMDSRQVIGRFEAERQALAVMDHPNIAKVLDADTTDSGRPYFVMELVRGIPITRYCDAEKLSTRERLNLFVLVCRAVQHAHQKGIVHRDLKPSNILVTLQDGMPVPKVIDFGIAKAIQQELTDKTIYTHFQEFIGTPAYMSPEQAEMSGMDIDTRSDIYSLGVLLYELLTGATPLDTQELLGAGPDEVRRRIREEEPARPSTRVSGLIDEELTTISERRRVDPPQLRNLLRGDLDWIVMKCLEKDRTRRYDTADGLAMDVNRHLSDQPVLARPPSTLYRVQKAWRRNKTVYGAGAAVLIALAVGLAIAALGWRQAGRQRAEAVQARAGEQVQRIEAQQSERKAVAAHRVARQRAYASDMNLAMEALHGNNLGRAQDLLNRQRPQPGESDLRGWEWRYLWQQTRSDALSALCQKSEIESLAISSDGRWLAIGLVHHEGVFVWDLIAREEVAHLAQGRHEVRAAFSPVEPLLAFASRAQDPTDETSSLIFWNVASRQEEGTFSLQGSCTGLAFSADGRKLVTSTATGSNAAGRIAVWRVSGGTQLASYPSHQYNLRPGTSFAATSDLSIAAYGSSRTWLHVMDLPSGKELWAAEASKDKITALAFSADGKTLASAAGFGESDIRLWDVASGQEYGRLEGHDGCVNSLVFWPEGGKLASASADQTIRIWDLESKTCTDVLRGHRHEVWRLALLPDNRTLVSGCKDGAVCLWDLSAARRRRGPVTWPDTLFTWCFTADSQSVLTLDEQGQVTQWGGSEFQEAERLFDVGKALSMLQGDHLRYQFSRHGRFLAGGGPEGSISVWDVSQRTLRRTFRPVTGPVYPLRVLARRGRLVGWSEATNRLYDWDLTTGREIQSWAAPASFDPLHISADHSPDERLFVAAGIRGDVILRDLERQSSTRLNVEILEPVGVRFDATGKYLASASFLSYARVWDARTWEEVATVPGFLNAATTAAFCSDGSRLAVSGAGATGALKLWATDSWQQVLTLRGEDHLFHQATFSPDGNAISVGTDQGRLLVWQAPAWEEIAVVEERQSDREFRSR